MNKFVNKVSFTFSLQHCLLDLSHFLLKLTVLQTSKYSFPFLLGVPAQKKQPQTSLDFLLFHCKENQISVLKAISCQKHKGQAQKVIFFLAPQNKIFWTNFFLTFLTTWTALLHKIIQGRQTFKNTPFTKKWAKTYLEIGDSKVSYTLKSVKTGTL